MSSRPTRPFTANPLIVIASEAQVQATIVEMGQYLGYRSYHETDSRKSERGFPDLTMVGTGKYRQVVYVEVKRDPIKNTKAEIRATAPKVEQVQWLEDLRASGHHAYVVRGSQIDILEQVLRMEFGREIIDYHELILPLVANEIDPVTVPVAVKRKRRPARR